MTFRIDQRVLVPALCTLVLVCPATVRAGNHCPLTSDYDDDCTECEIDELTGGDSGPTCDHLQPAGAEDCPTCESESGDLLNACFTLDATEDGRPDSCATCYPCQGTACTQGPGGADIGLHSLDARFFLGRTQDYPSAGFLRYRAKTVDDCDLLDVGTLVPVLAPYEVPEGEKVVTWEDSVGNLQVWSPQAVVWAVEGTGVLDILFYHPDEMEWDLNLERWVKTDQNVNWFLKWRVEDKGSDCDSFWISRYPTPGYGADMDYKFSYASGQGTGVWTLERGGENETILETRSWTVDGDDREETHLIQYEGENPVLEDIRTYRTMNFEGIGATEKLVAEELDPEGASLLTTWSYYTANAPGSKKAGKLELVEYPDGYWERYYYGDIRGRLTKKLTPWADQAPTTEESLSVVTEYSYVGVSDDRLSAVTRKVKGTVVEKTYYSYTDYGNGDWQTKEEERCVDVTASRGDPDNIKTVWTYYGGEGGADAWERGRFKKIEYPDGRVDEYTWDPGIYSQEDEDEPGAFTVNGSGAYLRRVITHGVQPLGQGEADYIAYKSTKEAQIVDPVGNVVLEELYVYNGTGYSLADWTVTNWNERSQWVSRYYANSTSESRVFDDCCSLGQTTDVFGIQTTYEYDSVGRLVSETKLGVSQSGSYPEQAAIVTEYTYDAASRVVTNLVSAGGLSLADSFAYDLAGRITASAGPDGLETSFSYGFESGQAYTLKTLPGGATEKTRHRKDRRVSQITGTAVVARYYDYDKEAGGNQWTKVWIAEPDSAMWEKTTVNPAGLTTSVERTAYSGTETTSYEYAEGTELLEALSQPGLAVTRYEYDRFGEMIRSGLDVGADGDLDLASDDRITEVETSFAYADPIWWRETETRVYAEEDDSTATTVSVHRTLVAGSGCETGPMKEEIEDVYGNTTYVALTIDAEASLVTRTVEHPDSATTEQTVTRNGLVQSTRTKTGITTTYGYDALGRRVAVTDPRTSTSEIHYNAYGQIDWVEDAADNRTTMTYSSTTGRLEATEDPAGKATYYQYTTRGELYRTWGDVPYPIEYAYDDWGRLVQMKTYQEGEDWEEATWPGDPSCNPSCPPSTTTWAYQEATGLLTNKADAVEESVAYTYGTAGRLATRVWARDSGTIETTYGYDADTGELATIVYSDGTPGVTNSYTRAGLLWTVADAVGSRTNTYNAALALEEEEISAGGAGLYDATITRKYQSSGQGEVPGRPAGLSLEGTYYDITYTYDTAGRLRDVVTASDVRTNPASHTFRYDYLANSNLVESIEELTSGITSTRAYETERDLLTQVKNEAGATVFSQYDYVNDVLGLRTSLAQSGTAFSTAWSYSFSYNDRDELTVATSAAKPTYNRGYVYDPIGNRTTATSGTGSPPPTTTYTRNLLNQYTATTNPNESFTFDDDGNLTADGTATYTYDAENRLVEVEKGNDRAAYTYDYLGRRVRRKTWYYAAVSSDTKYVWDGWRVIAELNGMSGDALQRTYSWGLDLSGSLEGAGGIGGLLAMEKLDGTKAALAFLYDGNGNVGQLVRLTDNALRSRYHYDPYGNAVYSYDPYANLYRFSTKPLDTVSGAYYFGYRWYSPKLGRWLTRDPIGERGGPNPIVYCENSPVSGVDYLGLVDRPIDICKCRKQCKPCNPSVGTKMYRVDRWPSRPHWINGQRVVPHTHHFRVTQRAVSARVGPCRCEVREDSVTAGVSPARDEIGQRTPTGGGVECVYEVYE